jgi:SAM-dependent methyltransferase
MKHSGLQRPPVCSDGGMTPRVEEVKGTSIRMLSADEANRRYFREAYRTGEHGWEVDEPSSYAVGFLRQVRRFVPDASLLDIGCGEGRHSFAAARMGFAVTAIDYEPLALRRARRFARSKQFNGIAFREANVFSLPFPDSCFDVVLDYGCFHHQKKADWPQYKSSLLRVLKPAGFYLLSVFSPNFRFFQGSRRSWHIAHGAYRRRFRRKEIVGLFDRDFHLHEIIEEKGKGGGFWHLLMRRYEALAES